MRIALLTRAARIGSALLAVAATGCFDAQPDKVTGGGGVETTEGNLASLGASPAGARVSLIPADFDPLRDSLPDSLTVLADTAGAYRFRGLAAGRYNLEAFLPSAGTRCFRPGVVIAKGDRAIAGTDTLAAPGRLRLTWDGTRKGVLTQIGRRFRLDLAALAADSGGITLDSLPAGLLPPFYFTDPADSAARIWTDSVRVAPGKLDSVPIREEWAHAAILTWDTTFLASDSLEGYPLLVRLASPDFPFPEAAPGGADLRFTTEDSVALPYAVENWDSAAGHAEIWVRLKARPDVGRASVRMYWGNPSAASRAGSVFGTDSGYAAVWHLNGETPFAALEDAGPFALPTSAVNLVPESQGVIGSALRFDGTGAYASAADQESAQATTRLCVSAWIMEDTAGLAGGVAPGGIPRLWTILSNWRESDTSGFVLVYQTLYDEVVFTIGYGHNFSHVVAGPLEDPLFGAWHLLQATYDGTEAAIWLDGKPMKTNQAEPVGVPLPSSEYLIGAKPASTGAGKQDFFRGAIDEAHVLRAVPSPTWLSLDYETQRPGSKLIRFQKLR